MGVAGGDEGENTVTLTRTTHRRRRARRRSREWETSPRRSERPPRCVSRARHARSCAARAAAANNKKKNMPERHALDERAEVQRPKVGEEVLVDVRRVGAEEVVALEPRRFARPAARRDGRVGGARALRPRDRLVRAHVLRQDAPRKPPRDDLAQLGLEAVDRHLRHRRHGRPAVRATRRWAP